MTDRSEAPPRPSRRTLVKGAVAGAGIATVAGLWFEGFGDPARRRRIEPTPEGTPLRTIPAEDGPRLAAVLDRLMPSGGPKSPGARDVNAIGYFDALFVNDEISDNVQALILWGLDKLKRQAQSAHGTPDLQRLDAAKLDALIKGMENDRDGIRWMRATLEFVIECLFGDPVHGGNPNEIGWKWIRHRPGTPRPLTPGWKLEEQP
ncbi:MAG: gluconate 2-dehydrogenase subunit 3 family protein [Planctomycetota bacterium]|nr:gluconate 2-dehydrogenase subunit 3 family protein [Planctomycetota bacterium]